MYQRLCQPCFYDTAFNGLVYFPSSDKTSNQTNISVCYSAKEAIDSGLKPPSVYDADM